MINLSIPIIREFRNKVFNLFHRRADATMELVDAIAENGAVRSSMAVSLSNVFRRQYPSITDAVDNFFMQETEDEEAGRRKQAREVAEVLSLQYETSEEYVLFGLDATSVERPEARCLKDRSFVYTAEKTPGAPVRIGHSYSHVVGLPSEDKRWVIPLSVRRVMTTEKSTVVGLKQFQDVIGLQKFVGKTCVNVADCAYGGRCWINGIGDHPGAIHIARMRNNRVVYRGAVEEEKKKRGRPRIYGKSIALKEPGVPDEESSREEEDGRKVHVERWNNVLVRDKRDDPTGGHRFDIVKVEVFKANGERAYERPMWLMIVGSKRSRIGGLQAYDMYGKRFRIEQYFRFGKQKLQMGNLKTSDVRHEENWEILVMIAYNMLHLVRKESMGKRMPWENQRDCHQDSPSQVQRDFARIIQRFGTPAAAPKRRGKSLGRRKGIRLDPRKKYPVVRKGRRQQEVTKEKKSKKSSKIAPAKEKGVTSGEKKKTGLGSRRLRRVPVASVSS